MRLAALALVVTLSAPRLAVAAPEDPPAAPEASVAPASATAAPAAPAQEERDPMFGLGLTVGAPDGAVLSFTWAPLSWLMVDAGFAYTLAPGMVFGLELQPIDFVISPTLRGEYGYYFTGQTSDRIKQWTGVPEAQWPLVGPASYDWFSGLIGIALGSRRGFTFRLEGGITYLQLNAQGGTAVVNGVEVTTGPWKASALAPTARLTFLYFF
jgi:hypothetical protein